MRACPFCAEEIDDQVNTCPHCSSSLTNPAPSAPVARSSSPPRKKRLLLVAGAVALVAALGGAGLLLFLRSGPQPDDADVAAAGFMLQRAERLSPEQRSAISRDLGRAYQAYARAMGEDPGLRERVDLWGEMLKAVDTHIAQSAHWYGDRPLTHSQLIQATIDGRVKAGEGRALAERFVKDKWEVGLGAQVLGDVGDMLRRGGRNVWAATKAAARLVAKDPGLICHTYSKICPRAPLLLGDTVPTCSSGLFENWTSREGRFLRCAVQAGLCDNEEPGDPTIRKCMTEGGLADIQPVLPRAESREPSALSARASNEASPSPAPSQRPTSVPPARDGSAAVAPAPPPPASAPAALDAKRSPDAAPTPHQMPPSLSALTDGSTPDGQLARIANGLVAQGTAKITVAKTLNSRGMKFHKAKSYDRAAAAFEAAYAITEAAYLTPIYNRACVAGLERDAAKAAEWLKKLSALGTPEAKKLLVGAKKDKDLNGVRDDPAVKAVLAE